MNTNKITRNIVIALILGIITGILLGKLKDAGFTTQYEFIAGALSFLGNAFIKLMKLITVPVVLASLTLGILNVGNIAKLARLGASSIIFFMFTTSIAILIAITVATTLGLGEGASYLSDAVTEYQAKEPESTLNVFLNIIPDNMFAPMVNSNMLQLIVVAFCISLVTLRMGEEQSKPIRSLFENLERIALGLIDLVMSLAPIGVYGLISKTFATEGFTASLPIAQYFGVVLLVLVMQFILVYPTIAVAFGVNPLKFLKGISRVIPIAFSTSSSNATLPFTVKNANEKLGVSKDVSSFVLPLGATINMDGTAIMQGVATVFLANIYGIDMTVFSYLSIITLAVLASIGTAGVPSVGLIMLTMILMQHNIPIDGIALILGVDRFLDMTRTAVNVTGDSLAAVIIAKKEKKLDYSKFNA